MGSGATQVPLPQAGGVRGGQVPLPQAGGVRGGPASPARPFKPRNTKRAKELRKSATPAERLLWTFLSRSQLGAKFSRQMQVENFFADFLCREHRLVIEIDGHSHDIQPGRDLWRDRLLREAGYHVIHFTNEDVLTNTEGVVTAIRMTLAEKAHPQPLPPAGGELR